MRISDYSLPNKLQFYELAHSKRTAVKKILKDGLKATLIALAVEPDRWGVNSG